MVKPPKTVIHINASGRCIFYLIILKFYKKARFLIYDLVFLVYRHLAVNGGNGGNGGVKKKMLNNSLILIRKKYVVQIYKIKLHTKNQVDWIKN